MEPASKATFSLPPTIKAPAAHDPNSFDVLRLTAALFVLFSHQFPLSGRQEWSLDNWQSLGGIGLLIFFVMSGFLVAESWMRDPNVWRFAARRLLRIWPALAVVVTLSACVLGPLMTSTSLETYFSSPQFARYFDILRFNDAAYLPHVFNENPNHAVNGSLWTLPIEVRWYEYLAAAGVLGLLRLRWALVALTVAIAIHYFVVFDVQQAIQAGQDRRWKEELGLYFLAGASLKRLETIWTLVPAAFAFIVASLGAVSFAFGAHHLAFWIWLPTATIFLARCRPGPLRMLTSSGDLSYGVYIYAFPVQQTVIALSENSWPFGVSLLVSAIATFACAWVSWKFVEEPTLRLKPRRPLFKQSTPHHFAFKVWFTQTFGLSKGNPTE